MGREQAPNARGQNVCRRFERALVERVNSLFCLGRSNAERFDFDTTPSERFDLAAHESVRRGRVLAG
jgi:hypothetical protein